MGIGFECCCSCQTPTVTVTGCGSVGVAGVTISFVLSGVTYGPWTTDGSGHAVIGIPAAGTAVFTITPPAGSGYDTLTATRSVNCSLTIYTFALSVSTGYQCAGPTCCVGGTTATGPPYLLSSIAWPTTLYLNDGFGTVTMSGVGGSTFHYTGCALRTAAFAFTRDDTACVFSSATNVSVPVYFTLNCSASTIKLNVDFARHDDFPCGASCQPAGVCGAGQPNLADILIGTLNPTCPAPTSCGFLSPPNASQATATGATCPPGSLALSFTIGPYVGGVACNVVGGSVETGLQNVPFQVYGTGPASIAVTS